MFQVVKKQEQTLKDLRVTLQRELKVQALPNDESSDMTTSSSASNSRSRSHKFDTNLQPDLQQYHQQKQYLRQQNYHQPSIVHTDSTNSALPAVLSVQGSSLSNMVTLTAMSSSVPTSATDALMVHTSNVKRELDKDINFLYLKHVILKFMLSRESEVSFSATFKNNDDSLFVFHPTLWLNCRIAAEYLLEVSMWTDWLIGG